MKRVGLVNKELIFEIIRDKLADVSFNGRLETARARYLLGVFFHFPKKKHSEILHIMHELDYINLSNSTYLEICNFKEIQQQRKEEILV